MPRQIDLNLLPILEALLRERSVTRAAQRLGLSQPATSTALAKLRRYFHDDLLVRSGNDYHLTPLAVDLLDSATTALTSTRKVFSGPSDFDPLQSDREFVIVMSDYALTVLGPALSQLADRQAPRVRLRICPTTRQNVDTAAETLRVSDLLVLPHGIISGLPYQNLYQDTWACLLSADHAQTVEKITVEQLANLPWVLTFDQGTAHTIAARELRTRGVELNVRMVIESYAALPALLAGTNRVALVQRRLGRILVAGGSVRMVPCPVVLSPVAQAIWWHPTNDTDAGHMWLRRCFATAAGTVSCCTTSCRAGSRDRPSRHHCHEYPALADSSSLSDPPYPRVGSSHHRPGGTLGDGSAAAVIE